MENQVRCRGWMLAVMVLIALLGQPVVAHAQQMTEFYEICNSDESKTYQYGSRYQCAFSIWDEKTGQLVWTGWNAPEVWNLTGEEPCGIPAYSLTAEPVMEMEAVCRYKKEPLSCKEKERLQAIMLHSFPYLSLEELEEKVKDMLGEGTVVNLTEGEAISAAQQAIWKVWYGEQFESEKLYVSIRGISQYQPSRFLYPESLDNSTARETTVNNIRNLYQYYLSFTGEESKTEGELGFSDVKYESVQTEDGSVEVSVSFAIEGISESENLYLTVNGEGFCRREPVCEREIKLTFSGLEKEEGITLMLDGTLEELQVFRFVSEQNVPELIGCRMEKHRAFAQLQIGPQTEENRNRIIVIHMDRIVPIASFSNLSMILMGIGIFLICAGLLVAIRCMCKDRDR